MTTPLDRVSRNPEASWLATLVGAVVALGVGAVAFPRRVYADVLWRYYWGPVYADAHDAQCVAWNGGRQTLGATWNACAGAAGPIAHPGYTPVSEVSYALVLVFMLVGVLFLLRRLDVGDSTSFVVALLPYVFFGGALRTVEDADNAVHAAGHTAFQYPLNTLIISPEIYLLMFGITVACLVASVWLARHGYVERYEYPLAGLGTLLLAVTLGYLVWLALTSPDVSFHAWFTVWTLVIATASAGLVWVLTQRYAPSVNVGTGLVGALVVWGQAIDGASNVLDTDWATSLGLRYDLVPKHPFDRAIISLSHQYLPASVNATLGASWPFLVVKVAIATLVISFFDDEVVGESPRFAALLLLAIIAVGLGPGTRDMLRATFGV